MKQAMETAADIDVAGDSMCLTFSFYNILDYLAKTRLSPSCVPTPLKSRDMSLLLSRTQSTLKIQPK